MDDLDMFEECEFEVTCKMPKRWADKFAEMLKQMEYQGELGMSRWLAFYSDGDGDYRPKFKFNGVYPDYKSKDGVFEGCEIKQLNIEYRYDAG